MAIELAILFWEFLKITPKRMRPLLGSVGNKFEALLNASSREKIKINFVAYRRNVGSPVVRNWCGLDVASMYYKAVLLHIVKSTWTHRHFTLSNQHLLFNTLQVLRMESATRVGRASAVVNLLVMQRALGPDMIDHFSDVQHKLFQPTATALREEK